jgi:hypothetical protein
MFLISISGLAAVAADNSLRTNEDFVVAPRGAQTLIVRESPGDGCSEFVLAVLLIGL